MKLGQWLRMFRRGAADEEVEQLLVPGVAPRVVADHQATARWGTRVLWLGAGLFLLWAFFVPLSQGVPAQGFVKVEGNRKAIQHLRGGIVDEILVKEGQRVEADQPLVRMNPTQFAAQLNILEGQLITTMAVEARLLAERRGLPKVVFPPLLVEQAKQANVREVCLAQEQLFRARRALLQGEESIGREVVASLEAQINGLEAQLASKTRQLELFNQELTSLRPLFEQGFVPRNRMFELERAVAYLGGGRSDDIANISRAQRQISETRLKVMQGRDTYLKEVETTLTETQAKVADLRERSVAAQDDLDRAVLKAPKGGIVVDLAVHTVGGVVAPGQKLMDIVPEDAGLVMEAQIPPHLIDNVRPGLEVDIHFSALDSALVLPVPGTLNYVSADRLTDQKTGLPYYVARVEPDPVAMAALGVGKVQPGMPADVVIKMKKRTLVAYLFEPLYKRLHLSLTER